MGVSSTGRSGGEAATVFNETPWTPDDDPEVGSLGRGCIGLESDWATVGAAGGRCTICCCGRGEAGAETADG